MESNKIKKELKEKANQGKAKIFQRFFKTGKGQYGEGEIFLGITVPESRSIAKKYFKINLSELNSLLHSKIHEERLVALYILVHKFENGNDKDKKEVVEFYLKNLKWVNNWDLVDTSCYKILGNYLLKRDKKILYSLANSNNLWEKRIAIISTYYFIKNNDFTDTLKISKILLKDEHDLIHKAVGWMRREVGKRDLKTQEDFMNKNHKKMSRTTLRYAIEKFSPNKRKYYLNLH
jgi:3-methyladenine DNA glycosylase AlkD